MSHLTFSLVCVVALQTPGAETVSGKVIAASPYRPGTHVLLNTGTRGYFQLVLDAKQEEDISVLVNSGRTAKFRGDFLPGDGRYLPQFKVTSWENPMPVVVKKALAPLKWYPTDGDDTRTILQLYRGDTYVGEWNGHHFKNWSGTQFGGTQEEPPLPLPSWYGQQKTTFLQVPFIGGGGRRSC